MPKTPAATTTLATNAPDDWPPVPLRDSVKQLDKLHLLTSIETAFRAAELPIVRESYEEVFPHGLLKIDLVVQTPKGPYPVFLYPNPNESAAAHFNFLERYRPLLVRIGRPVYYAPEPLPHTFQRMPLDMVLGFDRLPITPVAIPTPGDYAMWFANGDDPDLSRSAVLGEIDDYYRVTRGHERRLFVHLLTDVGIAQTYEEAELAVADLADRPFRLPAQVSDGTPVVLTYHAERGLRPHIHTQFASRDTVLRVWRLMKLWARRRLGDRPGAVSAPYRWWRDTRRRALEALQAEKQIQSLGRLTLGG